MTKPSAARQKVNCSRTETVARYQSYLQSEATIEPLHTLLSEAMHLGIPVYAMPLPVYEQQMNARVLQANGFGICYPVLAAEELSYYLGNIPAFASAIKQDKTVLLRGSAETQIVSLLTSRFLSSAD